VPTTYVHDPAPVSWPADTRHYSIELGIGWKSVRLGNSQDAYKKGMASACCVTTRAPPYRYLTEEPDLSIYDDMFQPKEDPQEEDSSQESEDQDG
jgi:hypothetical protein